MSEKQPQIPEGASVAPLTTYSSARRTEPERGTVPADTVFFASSSTPP